MSPENVSNSPSALISSSIAARVLGFTWLIAISQTTLWPSSPQAWALVVKAEAQIAPKTAAGTVSLRMEISEIALGESK
jgi:hypothetical protein